MSDDPFIKIAAQERGWKLQRHRKEFETFDRSELSRMDDRKLAEWQAGFEQIEAQWRLAEHEWQRRITAEQIAATMRAARGQAWFGIIGLFIGAALTLLGALLLRLLPP